MKWSEQAHSSISLHGRTFSDNENAAQNDMLPLDNTAGLVQLIVSGSFIKLTFAPTLKAGDVGYFLKHPGVQRFATWMSRDRRQDNDVSDDAFGSKGFNTEGEQNVGVQMET